MEKKNLGLAVAEWIILLILAVVLVWVAIAVKKQSQEASDVAATGSSGQEVGNAAESNSKEQDTGSAIDMGNSKLVLYEGPKTLQDATDADLKTANEQSRDFTLKHCVDTKVMVDGYDCYVYDTNINHNRQWFGDYLPSQSRTPVAYFDFEGAAEITVTVPNIDLQSVKISPLSDGIEPVIDAESHTVSFTITKADNYTLQFNDSPSRALHIFANPLEVNPPHKGDPDVVYIGPGEWNIDAIMLTDNQTLYLAGGAVVHGVVQSNYGKNIKVMGRGILDGSTFKGWAGKTAIIPLKFDNCDNVEIHDIIVLNPNAWVCQANTSTNGLLDGLRIISSRPNGDGISLQSCENYTVQNCFVRSWDDSLVVKNYTGDTKNITFKDNQLWTDLAQSMEVGYETNKGKKENAVISGITFENITVINNFHKPVISVHNADDATISDVTYKNITVENAQMGSGDADQMPYLIDINIAKDSNWSSTKDRGQIKNVLIDGVNVLSGRFNASRIHGFDAEHMVDGVTIKNLTILGEKITSFEQGKFDIDTATTKNLVIE